MGKPFVFWQFYLFSSNAEQCCCWQQCFWDFDLCRCVTAGCVKFLQCGECCHYMAPHKWLMVLPKYIHTNFAITIVLEWNNSCVFFCFFRLPFTHTHTLKLLVVAILCRTKCRFEHSFMPVLKCKHSTLWFGCHSSHDAIWYVFPFKLSCFMRWNVWFNPTIVEKKKSFVGINYLRLYFEINKEHREWQFVASLIYVYVLTFLNRIENLKFRTNRNRRQLFFGTQEFGKVEKFHF